MIKRAFHNKPATITFRKDFRNEVTGNVAPGSQIFIWYDAERLPYERSMDGDKPAWWIKAFWRTAANGPVNEITMWSRTGIILTGVKTSDDPGEGTMLKCDFTLPGDAQFLEMWFENSGRSGNVYYDSDYGRNYLFRFTATDIHVLNATVVSSPPTPYSRFDVSVNAAPDITAVSVRYFYWVKKVNTPTQETAALVKAPVDDAGRITWSSQQILAPYQVSISFDVEYTAWGRTFVDSNSGRHYIATMA